MLFDLIRIHLSIIFFKQKFKLCIKNPNQKQLIVASMYSCVQNNSIFNWLNGFSLGHYTELFNRYGYDSIDKLYQINHAILAEMGITSLLDRNRIIDNIQLLKKNSTATSINKIPSGKKTLKPSFNTTPNVTFYNNQSNFNPCLL